MMHQMILMDPTKMDRFLECRLASLPPAGTGLAMLLVLLASCFALHAAAAEEEAATQLQRGFDRDVRPLLARFCSDCHGEQAEESEAELALLGYASLEAVRADRETWMNVDQAVLFGAMPPEDSPQPSQEDRQRISRWIQSVFDVDCSGPRDPGRPTIRRLNRFEYDNTVRDLLGVDLRLSEDFPSDDVGEGFDNIGDVLSLPPLLLEKYVRAAERAAAAAIEVEGSADRKTEELPESHRRILFTTPAAEGSPRTAAAKILERFAARAYRRPLREDELNRLVDLAESVSRDGEPFARGIQVAVTAVLVSPHFLYRVERDPAADDAERVRRLSDYELATRLSYFLWSTMPDEELFELARRGKLQEQPVLRKQVRRMLAEAKSEALVTGFGSQWLNLRNLAEVTPDTSKYPFDDGLRDAMRRETELFFAAVIREDRSILDFLTGDFTFVNERLARHYGLEGVRGDAFQRVSLASSPRLGVVTQASILTLTSNPTRTSPVKRGKWILENVLGTPPPEPPANVPALEQSQSVSPNATLRELMVLHRSDPVCASCHRTMDELGFGLENFDAVGRWREEEQGRPLDASGELPSGERFRGPGELIGVLANRQREFSQALTRKMLVYALGRGLQPYDRCAVDEIAQRLEQESYRFSALVLGIVESEPFQLRRGDGG